jgi:hypothetical protein
MNSFERRELTYMNKDIPVFHYFHYPELAAFKFFFWKKSLLQYPQFSKSLFPSEESPEGLHDIAVKIVAEYNKIPSREVWNVENIHSTIRQIEYYKETKVFKSPGIIINLYECLEKTIDHIERQAELGYKFLFTDKTPQPGAPYKLFVNEFILGDNTLCVTLNDSKRVYLNHTVLNFIETNDIAFTDYTYQYYQNIIRRSTLISDVGEKERSRFFNTMREKVHNRKRSIGH